MHINLHSILPRFIIIICNWTAQNNIDELNWIIFWWLCKHYAHHICLGRTNSTKHLSSQANVKKTASQLRLLMNIRHQPHIIHKIVGFSSVMMPCWCSSMSPSHVSRACTLQMGSWLFLSISVDLFGHQPQPAVRCDGCSKNYKLPCTSLSLCRFLAGLTYHRW